MKRQEVYHKNLALKAKKKEAKRERRKQLVKQ